MGKMNRQTLNYFKSDKTILQGGFMALYICKNSWNVQNQNNVNCRPGVVIMCQCGFINCNKCTSELGKPGVSQENTVWE